MKISCYNILKVLSGSKILAKRWSGLEWLKKLVLRGLDYRVVGSSPFLPSREKLTNDRY